MFKSGSLFFGLYVISLSCMAGPLPLNCQTSTTLEENFNQLEEVVGKVDECPRPKDGKFVNICTMVENQDPNYKTELMTMSCVNPKKDSPETVKSKVNYMWETYYKEFGCDSSGFLVAQGNVLKYSVNQEFEYFVDGVVEEFGLNINLKDPSDGKTLLDFTLDEINRYKGDKDFQYKVPELERIYSHLKNDLKAKHSKEL
jgi:hypothetical protein